MRVACLYVPALPLQALLRAEPELRGLKVAVLDSPSSGARVVAASPEAQGVLLGQLPAQARAACPGVVLRTAPRPSVRSAQEALLDVAWAFSQQVEPGPWDSVQLGVGDLDALYPSEAGLAAALRAQAARAGLDVDVAVAASSPLAQVLARAFIGVTAVPAEKERELLSLLPVHALCPPQEAMPWLARWGVRTAGELAALPRSQVARRLGAAGVALHRLAAGEDRTPLRAAPPPAQVREAVELEDPIDSLEALSFLLRGVIDRLCVRLGVLGHSCRGYTLRLSLFPRERWGEDVRVVPLAVPGHDVATLLAAARRALRGRPPVAPVQGIAVSTTLPEAHITHRARAQVPCGPEEVAALGVIDSYLPGQAEVVSWPAPDSSGPSRQAPSSSLGSPVLARVFRPPWPAEVTLLQGVPHHMRAAPAAGLIRSVVGPYRIRVGFQQPVLREYFEVELQDGAVCRVFQDLCTGAWFLDGRYG